MTKQRTTNEFVGITHEVATADVVCGLKNRWGREALHCGDHCPMCGERISREIHTCERPITDEQIARLQEKMSND